ncbi:hypothetical protein GQ55_5G513100 [Panicum hallii var. hallii]|uniref:Uncharacterized protein n=1 Tax=Panicum hallii var. hallii TaxID=1504633 RepID=A0A2T7DSE2_9POAL|nr:hypothetical protein GQ55_5G513100 [Panicum hallii var. hallii]
MFLPGCWRGRRRRLLRPRTPRSGVRARRFVVSSRRWGSSPFLQSCRASPGFRGGLVVGPSSSFPRGWRSSTASSGPRAEVFGVRPRSMGDRRRLYPVPKDGCLLRLLSKPERDGALF